jgi:hypothetical protein
LKYCEIMESGSIGITPVNIHAISAYGQAPFLNNVVINKGTWGIQLVDISSEFRAVNVTIDSMYTSSGARNVDIKNCPEVSIRFADSYFSSGDYAFGIYGNNTNSNLEIVNSIITNHMKESFAAIWISSSTGNIKMIGCQLYGNELAVAAPNVNADIFANKLELRDCIFYNNEGAMKLNAMAFVGIENCTFRSTEQLNCSYCSMINISNSLFEDSGMIYFSILVTYYFQIPQYTSKIH